MTFIEYSIDLIKKSGGRVTKTKLAVLEALAKLQKPLNPYEIAEKIKMSGGKIDVVTVYRMLEIFEELHLVHKSEKGFVPCKHYTCNNDEHCHHQFFCNKCERAFEVHIDDKDFLQIVKQKFGNLLIKSHDFRFSGLCQKCQS